MQTYVFINNKYTVFGDPNDFIYVYHLLHMAQENVLKAFIRLRFTICQVTSKLGQPGPHVSGVRLVFLITVVTSVNRLSWFQSMFDFLAFVIIFLSRSMSLSERTFLYDVMDGSLKISRSNGCCCIKCHLFIRISLSYETTGLDFVARNKIRFVSFLSSNSLSSRLGLTKFTPGKIKFQPS